MGKEQNHSGIGDNYNIEGDANFNSIQKQPSILADVINHLGKELSPTNQSSKPPKHFKIENKIKFNNVKVFKGIFNEFKVFQAKINSLYEELDKSGSTRKGILLQNIYSFYLKIKGQYLKKHEGEDEQDVINMYADEIIEKVENELLGIAAKSDNLNEKLETVKVCLNIIIVDAFMRCKILEEPTDAT